MTIVEWVGILGSFASIGGLIVTLYVARTIRMLRSRVMLKTCLGKLQAHQKNLSSSGVRRNTDKIRQELSCVNIVLERVALHSSKRSTIKWRIAEIDQMIRSRDEFLQSRIDDVTPLLGARIERLELDLTELEWGK